MDRVNGYRFDGKDVIAGCNTDQAITIAWPGRRDPDKIKTDPLFWFRRYANLPTGAEAVLGLTNGKWGDAGDLSFKVTTKPDGGNMDWTSRLR